MSSNKAAVVLAHGSVTSKVGFSGDHGPKTVFPTIIGRPKDATSDLKKIYVGQDASDKENELSLTRPVEAGVITNWDDMETLWQHTFDNVLQCSSEERPILLIDVPSHSKENREKMTKIMFEKFKVPALFIAKQAVMALYTTGRKTGLVLDSGSAVTYATPVIDGFAIPDAVTQTPLGGRDVTQYLIKLLSDRGLKEQPGLREINAIKEQLCYVAADYESEIAKPLDVLKRSYELQSKDVIAIDKECVQGPEGLLRPQLYGLDCKGFAQIIHESIQKCDQDVRKGLYEGIVLTGGSTNFRGMADRLKKEIAKLAPDGVTPNVTAPVAAHMDWIGGSILASLPEFETMWITKAEFEENGPSIVHKKYV